MLERHFHSLFIDGKDLADFGVHCSGDKTFSSPERDYEVVEVPGRSGDLYIDKGRYKNVEVEYDCFILDNLERNLRALRGFLLNSRTYRKLEDTYHPDEYRMAMFTGPLEPEIILLQGGNFTLKFNCKPQRYLKSGEQSIIFNISGNANETKFTVYNPTEQDAYPIYRVYNYSYTTENQDASSGTLRVNNGKQIHYFAIPRAYPYVDIDCELKDSYYGSINMNSYISILYENYPILNPGENIVSMAGIDFKKLEIIPRWWEV